MDRRGSGAACNSRAFAVETAASGARKFLIASPHQFWGHYSSLAHEDRHHYEIIRAATPCHLYFDLEYDRSANVGAASGGAAVQSLLAVVREELRAAFGLRLSNSWIIELDSSTPTKFSRHVIVRIPGCAWADNHHAGLFVKHVCAVALTKARNCSAYASLIVSKPAGQCLFVDLGVYTRNRAFRLFLSSKYGKAAYLAGTTAYAAQHMTPQQLFFASLITHFDAPLRPLPRRAEPRAPCAQGAGPAAARGLTLLTVHGSPLPPDCVAPTAAWVDVHSAGVPQEWRHLLQLGSVRAVPASAATARLSGHADFHASSVAQPAPSPFASLDTFIESRCTQDGTQGRVRSWRITGSCVMYNMRDTRWCGNIGRQHKSNGVYIIADLEAGVWRQRCYDPSCRAYQSPAMPLPAAVWQQARDALLARAG